MQRRLPKRGFLPPTRTEYVVINLYQLDAFEAGSCVDVTVMQGCGLLKSLGDGVKILAKGDITKPLTIKAHKFSSTAKEKIIAAGGSVEEI
jgi:large subunit ribosomal protein L15